MDEEQSADRAIVDEVLVDLLPFRPSLLHEFEDALEAASVKTQERFEAFFEDHPRRWVRHFVHPFDKLLNAEADAVELFQGFVGITRHNGWSG